MHQLIMSRSSATRWKLLLIFRIGLGMGIRGIRMTHVAAYADCSTEQLYRMKDLVALVHKGVSLRSPDFHVAIVNGRVGVALLRVI